MATAHLFIDYQNTHITGWENYAPWNSEPYEHLVHPGKYATEIEKRFSEDASIDFEITEVHAFRGLADPRKQSRLNSAAQKQHRAWQMDPRVHMHTRALRYPSAWPNEKAQEKGVDVMLALAIVRATLSNTCDLVIVATRDTDILPAIEMCEVERPGQLALVAWERAGSLKPKVKTPTILLGQESFNRSCDTTVY